jgi:outer membrane immunogenic protein
MRHTAIAIAVIAALIGTPALAADIALQAPSPPPSCTWCGWYVGGNAGWVGSANNGITNTGTDTGPAGLGTAVATGAIPSSLSLGYSGFVGGGQVGYNWQPGNNWLLGLEADFDGVSARSSITTSFITIPPFVPQASGFDRELDWLSTIRARLGVTSGTVLFYGTGGLAIGETKISNQYICPICLPPASTEPSTSNTVANTSVGWTAGAGVEWMFAPKWSLKAEYLYVDLGTHSSTIVYSYTFRGVFAETSSMTSSVRDTANVVRAGINWHF